MDQSQVVSSFTFVLKILFLVTTLFQLRLCQLSLLGLLFPRSYNHNLFFFFFVKSLKQMGKTNIYVFWINPSHYINWNPNAPFFSMNYFICYRKRKMNTYLSTKIYLNFKLFLKLPYNFNFIRSIVKYVKKITIWMKYKYSHTHI